jgi:hypothetical protein
MAVKNAASALGEAIGRLIEDEIERAIKPVCNDYGYVYDRGGQRPDKREGVQLEMINKSGNTFRLDGVIEAPDGKPVVLLESKYLRYKKHNRDKASWTCAAHYNLRKSYPTVRKSIAILSGNWSEPSKKFMESFGVELYVIPFAIMCETLKQHGIEFNWDEKDIETPQKSWRVFQMLPDKARGQIAETFINPIRNKLISSIEMTLKGGEDWIKRIHELELLLKTDRNEYFTYSFKSVREVMIFLLELQEDVADLRDIL